MIDIVRFLKSRECMMYISESCIVTTRCNRKAKTNKIYDNHLLIHGKYVGTEWNRITIDPFHY